MWASKVAFETRLGAKPSCTDGVIMQGRRPTNLKSWLPLVKQREGGRGIYFFRNDERHFLILLQAFLPAKFKRLLVVGLQHACAHHTTVHQRPPLSVIHQHAQAGSVMLARPAFWLPERLVFQEAWSEGSSRSVDGRGIETKKKKRKKKGG